MSHPDRAIVEASLAQAAETVGDPAGLVYARLFTANPAMAALFCNDKSGSVKGEMLARAFDTILDFVGDGGYAPHLMRAERDTHAGYGVDPAVFMTFFETLFEALDAAMGDAWSVQTRTAWRRLLADMRAVMDEGLEAGR
jgi:hemoglobin-like flavoprotein